jgi:hypothetical protein
MNGIQRARTFLLGAYHDLPNVLFIGALLLGALVGYLPLVFLSIGLILNGISIAAFQGFLRLLFPTWSQVVVPANSVACDIFGKINGVTRSPLAGELTAVAPSHWIGAAAFFAVFSIYNSARIYMRDSARGASPEKVDNRRAFSLSTLVIGVVFLLFVFARGFTGCETWLGSSLGAVIGGGLAVVYWGILDACGAGTVPDILQVVGSMAPSGDAEVPVVCTAPPSDI